MMGKEITQEYLRELFDYIDGELVWKKKSHPKSPIKIGTVAGCISNGHGYRQVYVDGRLNYVHRLIWVYHYGRLASDIQIDHIDHNRTNNSLSNLRLSSSLENNQNQSRSSNNTSGCTGVFWNKQKGKWWARGILHSKQIHLGFYVEIWDAICARKSWEVKAGFHVNHGC